MKTMIVIMFDDPNFMREDFKQMFHCSLTSFMCTILFLLNLEYNKGLLRLYKICLRKGLHGLWSLSMLSWKLQADIPTNLTQTLHFFPMDAQLI